MNHSLDRREFLQKGTAGMLAAAAISQKESGKIPTGARAEWLEEAKRCGNHAEQLGTRD